MSSPDSPRVVSLFSGCGGSSLGYKLAGCDVLLAADNDEHAVQTYRLNFDGTPVWDRDVAELDGDRIRELTGLDLQEGDLDILDGSPPCQGFSNAKAHRDVFDERNFLFLEYVRILTEMKPKVFVMENVAGMIQGRHRWVFSEIFRRLEGTGYRVKGQLVNAARLGVPQSRQRVILVGVRTDLDPDPVHPEPDPEVMTVGPAFEDLPEDTSRTLNDKMYHVWKRTLPGRSFADAHPKGSHFGGKKLHPRRPANTLTKMVWPSGGAGNFHWRYPRCLNEAELRRVSTFPDDFVVEGGLLPTWRRFGNAVPPRMMERIATRIRTDILEEL